MSAHQLEKRDDPNHQSGSEQKIILRHVGVPSRDNVGDQTNCKDMVQASRLALPSKPKTHVLQCAVEVARGYAQASDPAGAG